jgi:excisionase family DNA binding protein
MSRDIAFRSSRRTIVLSRNWLTVAEVAQLLRKDEQTVRRWARLRLHLPYTRIGHAYQFDAADVEQYLAQERREPEAQA